jgi:hypothetical protein
MTPELQNALEKASSKLRATPIDGVIFKALITDDLNAQDAKTVGLAAKSLLKEDPNCLQFQSPQDGRISASRIRKAVLRQPWRPKK